MIQEPPPPKNLQKLQLWFASIIERPIDVHNNMLTVAPSGTSMEYEASKYIAPNEHLRSHQRIEIYNQQYWWRLLSVMHDTFPVLVRLFGFREFNQKIAFPYLVRYNPNHWSLSYLGERLPIWVKRFYSETDKQLVQAAADIDNAFNLSFIDPHYPPVTAVDFENIMDRPLYLQPHIYLFHYEYAFFQFRDVLVGEEVDYWTDNDFPKLPKEKPFGAMVWRDHNNHVGWIFLEPYEYQLLKHFKNGMSFDALCEWLETQPAKLYKAASESLDRWINRWLVNEWLTTHSQQ